MAITPVKLNKVITGSKQKYFYLDVLNSDNEIIGHKLYIANIEKNDSNLNTILQLSPNTDSNQLTNICNIFSSSSEDLPVVIKNMFEINNNEDFETRTYAYTNPSKLEFTTASDYSDLFISNYFDINSIVGFNDSVFTLTNKLNTALDYYTVDTVTLLNNGSSTTEKIYSPLYTAIFDSVSALENLSKSEFEEKYVPKALINGISYNNLVEYPNSIYPLFKENTLIGTALLCKNHLGYDYSQHSKEIHEDNNTVREFSQLRTYNRLISSGNNLYLVYTNNTKATTEPYIGGEYMKNGYIINVNTENIDNTNVLDNMEKVEMVNSVNRYTHSNKHKASLYSIEVEDIGLNSISKSNPALSSTINNIKKSITNNIKKICQKVQPGNTQLFSVFYTGN